MSWTPEALDPSFAAWFGSLTDYQQAVLDAAIEHVLVIHGPDICQGEFGKNLGGGLYEFRVRHSLRSIMKRAGRDWEPDGPADDTVLLRVFCHFHGDRVILLISGLDKGKNEKAQSREIERARKLLRAYQAEQKRAQKDASKSVRKRPRNAQRNPRRNR